MSVSFMTFSDNLEILSAPTAVPETQDGPAGIWGFLYACDALLYTVNWAPTYQRSSR
jgi:hypothetical protein